METNDSNPDVKVIYNNLLTRNKTYITKAEDSYEYNAHNKYYIIEREKTGILQEIKFQTGPIKEVEINGIFIEDLIAICIDRLLDFQESKFACSENRDAIMKLMEALEFLRQRTEDRKKRKVYGTNKI